MRRVNFDFIAPVYDVLARLVFGGAIRESHRSFLHELHEPQSILILGGGTGEILPELVSRNPDAKIYFVDASGEMIARAKKRSDSENIVFLVGTEDEIPANVLFDTVLTFYYLDLFDDRQLPEIITKIKTVLKPGGTWLVADFTDKGKWWHPAVLTFMYLFFRFSAGVRVRRLPDWRNHLEQAGLRCTLQKLFKGGLIEGRLYKN